jgi:hypothetical protein
MSILKSFIATMGGARPITVSSNWSFDSGTSPRPSADRTLTVPSGNPGTLTFAVTLTGSLSQYRKNSGSYVGLVDGDITGWANGDTLGFLLFGSSGDEMTVTVTDTATGTLVGDWTGQIS